MAALIVVSTLWSLGMNAYPVELRSRILDALDRGVGSVPQVARLFRVATNSVYNLLRLRQQTDSLQPRPNPGGHPPAIPEQRYDEVRRLIAEQPDLTLAQIRDRLGLTCSEAAVCRTLKKLGLSRKKKRSTPPSSSGPTYRRHARSGSSGRRG
jgi:transposase